MSDEQSRSSYAPFIALAVVLVLFVLALVCVLITALIVFGFVQAAPPAASIDATRATPLNRLAVIAGDQIYTIDPDGAQRVDLQQQGVMAINGQRTYTLVASAPVPPRGRLMAELDKNLPPLKFPFAVSNLTLLGQQRTEK